MTRVRPATGNFKVTLVGENTAQEESGLQSPFIVGNFSYDSLDNGYYLNGEIISEEDIKRELWRAFNTLRVTYLAKDRGEL